MEGKRTDISYNNSKYTLQIQQITIVGRGLSHDYNTAQFNALANTREIIIDTMAILINDIAIYRGFDSSLPNDFYLPALRHISYHDDTVYSDKGAPLHRSLCIAKVMLTPMLQSLYREKHFPPQYGYYQFLRDIDYILMTH